MAAGRLPDFLIAGTQKAGTTWLEATLGRHPDAWTPGRQIHFFDRHWDRGTDWYRRQFARAGRAPLAGEKTTEYFDARGTRETARRIARTCPGAKLIVILRDPVERALSALAHTVRAGRAPIPADCDGALFDGGGHGYVERGFYARQLADFRAEIPADRILVLIFEEDVVDDPARGWARTAVHLGLDPAPVTPAPDAINRVRLSRPAIRLSRLVADVPYARGAIRRIDARLGLAPWAPAFGADVRTRLAALYAEDRERLFEMLGRRVEGWTGVA